MKLNGQRNAFLLGNKNSIEGLSEQIDPVDHYYGFYTPWISVEHLNVLERAVDAQPTSVDSPTVISGEGQPRLFFQQWHDSLT